MVLYGEEEEEMMANSEDPIIRTIWNNKIVAPYNAVPQIRPVYEGKKVFIDWKSGLEPAIFVRYSTPAGDPLIHVASNPVFMPNYPGWFFISTISGKLLHNRSSLSGGVTLLTVPLKDYCTISLSNKYLQTRIKSVTA